MNDNAKKWVAALRSGKYSQTKSYLHALEDNEVDVPAGYCCLGVACDLYQDEVGNLETTIEDEGWVRYNASGAHLPIEVVDWLGLTDSHGNFVNFEEDKVWSSLVSMNDNGCTFAEIADKIESEPKELFVK